MSLFTTLEDQVIIRTAKGVYKQARIATRDEYFYARINGGFVMLYANGTTSHPDLRWVEMSTTLDFVTGSLGRLVVAPGVKALEAVS